MVGDHVDGAGWSLTVEGCSPVEPASMDDVVRALKTLSNWKRRTFAVLARTGTDDFYQCAGTPAGMALEKRAAESLYRAYQATPVVPFEDGTVLQFRAGSIALGAVEWFTLWQVADVFWTAIRGLSEPQWLMWRDITEVLYPTPR